MSIIESVSMMANVMAWIYVAGCSAMAVFFMVVFAGAYITGHKWMSTRKELWFMTLLNIGLWPFLIGHLISVLTSKRDEME